MERQFKVSLQKESDEIEVSDDLHQIFSDLPTSSEIKTKISKLLEEQEREKFLAFTAEIKDTIKDSINRNIPAVGFVTNHRTFILENLQNFEKTFEKLGYLMWDFMDLQTGKEVLYVIFDLEHFGLKERYKHRDDPTTLDDIRRSKPKVIVEEKMMTEADLQNWRKKNTPFFSSRKSGWL